MQKTIYISALGLMPAGVGYGTYLIAKHFKSSHPLAWGIGVGAMALVPEFILMAAITALSKME